MTNRPHSPLARILPAVALAAMPAAAMQSIEAQGPPLPASPVGRTWSRCPTFSWSAATGAEGVEIAAFALDPNGEVGDTAALSVRLPAGVQSWTPPLEQCLEPGTRYAWSVRGVAAEEGRAWSEPALVEVTATPPLDEIERVVAALERAIEAADDPARGAELSERLDRLRRPVSPLVPAGTACFDRPTGSQRESAPGSTGLSAAALRVAGEVRTVDAAGQTRVWGRGREGAIVYERVLNTCSNGGVKFGLSDIAVAWGSAADACPAGTWVCTEAERGSGSCDTIRPDDTEDLLLCDGSGVDYPQNSHWGWLDDLGSLHNSGRAANEGTVRASFFPCFSLPVWCCWL